LRASSQGPIIVLSVQSKEAEKVRLLELGTDDYLVKPFGMAELLTRSHAALRRHVPRQGSRADDQVGPTHNRSRDAERIARR
jgi:two-component system KDP operon response regulator KdpE